MVKGREFTRKRKKTKDKKKKRKEEEEEERGKREIGPNKDMRIS